MSRAVLLRPVVAGLAFACCLNACAADDEPSVDSEDVEPTEEVSEELGASPCRTNADCGGSKVCRPGSYWHNFRRKYGPHCTRRAYRWELCDEHADCMPGLLCKYRYVCQ